MSLMEPLVCPECGAPRTYLVGAHESMNHTGLCSRRVGLSTLAEPASLSLDEIDRLLGIAAKHGVMELSFRGLSLRRVPETTPVRSAAQESELTQIEKMPSDKIDAALRLERIKGGR